VIGAANPFPRIVVKPRSSARLSSFVDEHMSQKKNV